MGVVKRVPQTGDCSGGSLWAYSKAWSGRVALRGCDADYAGSDHRWIIIGLIGGSLTGLLAKRDREGFGMMTNLGLGLAGAFVGGLLFRLFGLLPDLDRISISLRDVVAAVIGSLLVLIGLWLWRRSQTVS
jgi:uncharacterized membrane protein YeaQ/YmgE (transglycosylase-associated protein family)